MLRDLNPLLFPLGHQGGGLFELDLNMGCCVGGSKPPLIPPWASRGRDNLLFAERRGRVQAKRRTQGMHENWTDSRLSKPPLIPPWTSRGRVFGTPCTSRGGISGYPLHIQWEGFRIVPWAARGRDYLLFAERRGRVQAKRRTQGMHENWTDSRLSKPPLIPPWTSRGRVFGLSLGHQGEEFRIITWASRARVFG